MCPTITQNMMLFTHRHTPIFTCSLPLLPSLLSPSLPVLLSLPSSLSVSNIHHSSIYWERCYSLSQYPALIMPHPPRILDPANPANNLYISGVGSYSPYQHCGEYMVGDGNWTVLARLIDSLDLSKPVNHWV